MDELQLPEGTISESHSVDSQGRRHVQITITPIDGEIKPNNRPSPGSMGNTTGIILPVTSPEVQRAQATVQPETAEEESWWGSWGGTVHLGLDLIGMVPVLGEVADLANAAIYAAEGDTVNALMSLASAAPGAGNAVTAAKWGKRGMEAVDTAADATKAVKAAKGTKAAKAADAPKPKAGGGGPKPPKKTGGKSKRPRKKRVGDCGESIAKDELRNEGFDDIVSVENKSGHGVDVIGRNSKTGDVKVLEVKTSETKPGGLSKAQRNLGGGNYTKSRLNHAIKGDGHWSEKNAPGMKKVAEVVEDWLEDAPKVDYEHMQVEIEDIDTGCRKKGVKRKPWK